MYVGVRSAGWIFWYWWRIKQKIGKGFEMSLSDKLYSKIVKLTLKSMTWYKNGLDQKLIRESGKDK